MKEFNDIKRYEDEIVQTIIPRKIADGLRRAAFGFLGIARNYFSWNQRELFKIVTVIAIATILVPIPTGCDLGKSPDGRCNTQQKSELSGEFIIMAFCGPPPGEATLERFREVAESGIEILVPANGISDAKENLKVMDLAKKVGIHVIPVDERIIPYVLKPDVPIDTAVIMEMVNDYKGHPALAGYVITDEPGAVMFPALRILTRLFLKQDPSHEPLINLLPSYGSPSQLGFDDYRAYISTFIETVKPGILSYDNYPLREGTTEYASWYNDLKIIREETRKNQIPFMVFVQSEGIRGGLRVPNRAEILWQVNSALAYGSQGFGWFCYWTPQTEKGIQQIGGAPPAVESHYNAMIDNDGKRTEVYDFVREINFYLKKVGKGLLTWNNTNVARYEAGALFEGGSSPLVTPSGDKANLVVGTYMKNNTSRIVLSNSHCEKSSEFTIQITKGWKIRKVYDSIDATPTGDTKSLSEWSLSPGGSVILELFPQ